MRRLLPLLCCLAPWAAAAQPAQVQLNGLLGARSALIIVDGEPLIIELGASRKGVRLVALEEGRAVVDYGGGRHSLTLGAAPGRVAAQAARAGRILLPMGPGGHYIASGTINGQATRFLLDTGATNVAIGEIEADRLGLRYRDGRRVITQTANGQVPAYLLRLASLRIDDVEVRDVEAIVIPGVMSHVLLGNSFLNRFQLRRETDVMTLQLRP